MESPDRRSDSDSNEGRRASDVGGRTKSDSEAGTGAPPGAQATAPRSVTARGSFTVRCTARSPIEAAETGRDIRNP
jgi:hypothetical protein